MSTRESIRDLIAKAQAGDRSAFDALLEEHRPRLEALIGSKLGAALRASTTIEDVLQDALLEAFRSLERFEWRGEDSFMRWLGGIAENAVLKASRCRERGLKLQARVLRLGPLSPEQVSPSKALRREERFERLKGSLSGLSPEHREVIVLSRIEGLPIAEIARKLGRSEEAAKSLLARAIRELRGSFGKTESMGLPPRSLGAEDGR